jgi:ankyrin repeat protein
MNLLENNADVNLKANNGLSALSYAIQGQNIKVVKMIGEKTDGSNNEGLLMTVVKM